MVIVLSEKDCDRLERCRVEFNRFTGKRFDRAEFVRFCVSEMIADNEFAVENARKLASGSLVSRHVY